MSNDLVFKPTPTAASLDLSSPALSPSLQSQIRLLIQHELDVLTESEWFIEFIDERILQAFEINEEQED